MFMNYELKERIARMTLNDDIISKAVMSDGDLAREFIEAIHGVKISRIKLTSIQSELNPSLYAKSVRFDVEFVGDETVYDIEMQQSSENGKRVKIAASNFIARRVRYYQSAIDTKYSKPGMDYSELPETRIIFICGFDPFGKGRAQYVQRPCLDDGTVVDNGTVVTYLNTKFLLPTGNCEIDGFLRYMRGEGVSTDLTVKLENAVIEAKESRDVRSKIMNFSEWLYEYCMDRAEKTVKEKAEKELKEKVEKELKEKLFENNVRNLMRNLGINRDKAIRLLKGDDEGGTQSGGVSRIKLD